MRMRIIDATAFRRNLFATLKEVGYDGRPIGIRRHGRVVAVITPPEQSKAEKAVKPKINRRRIARFCMKHRVCEFSLFGSILRDDFGPDSDVDVLVEPKDAAGYGIVEWSDMLDELRQMFGRPVDLLTRRSVEASKNPYRKKSILEGAKVIYVSPAVGA